MRYALVGACAAALVTATVAFAGGNQVVRLSNCHRGLKSLSWNIRGRRGARGLRGAEGPQGPTGPAGSEGLKGDKGEKGEKGDSAFGRSVPSTSHFTTIPDAHHPGDCANTFDSEDHGTFNGVWTRHITSDLTGFDFNRMPCRRTSRGSAS
jgi:hypothetical protein